MISFAAYSAILSFWPISIVIIIVLQIISDVTSKTSDRATTTLLYSVYVSSLACASIGFSLHLFTDEVWCERYGMIPCFSMLGGSKAVLYLFFIRRAKLAQGLTISKHVKLLLNHIAPCYLFIYWIAYCVLTTFLFKLKYTPHDISNTVSNCLFGEWAIWFLAVAGSVDVFNCLSSLALFLWPLMRTLHESKVADNLNVSTMDKATAMVHAEFVSVMKWNVILSFVASLSSVLTLVMITVSNHYIWLFCLGDPFINSICTYFMIASNRRFLVHHVAKLRTKTTGSQEKVQHKEERKCSPKVDRYIDKRQSASTGNDDDSKPTPGTAANETVIEVNENELR